MNRFFSEELRLFGFVGAVIAIFLSSIITLWPQLFRSFDHLAYDSLLSWRSKAGDLSDVVIIDVDEKSLAEVGQWPWPRDTIGKLVDVLHDSGAQQIALDFLFSEEERHLPSSAPGNTPSTPAVMNGVLSTANDGESFTDVFMHSQAVLGIWFDFSPAVGEIPKELPPSPIIYRSSRNEVPLPPTTIPDALNVVSPQTRIMNAGAPFGFINALPDADGKVRRFPLLIGYKNQTYPSMALAAMQRLEPENGIVVRTEAGVVAFIDCASRTLSTDRNGCVLLPYSRNESDRFTRFSASDILSGHFPAGAVQSKAVVVGSSAISLFDFHPTPLDRHMPGVVIQALAIDSLMTGTTIAEPTWAMPFYDLMSVLGAAFAVWTFYRHPSVWSVFITTLMILSAWLISHVVLDGLNIYLSPVPATSSLTITMLSLGLVRFRSSEQSAFRHAIERSQAQDCAMIALVTITEARDPETGSHVLRTQHYVRLLAEHLIKHPRFANELTRRNIEIVTKSAPLHDIGKVGVPDEILLKPGKLTDEEFSIMKRHTTYGHDTLERAQRSSGLQGGNRFFTCATQITLSHHEKWDGSGYPHGLAGDAIPIPARLMALADVYDALRSARPYKEGFTHEKSAAIIREGAGTHFDADIVQAFIDLEDDFQRVWNEYTDPE